MSGEEWGDWIQHDGLEFPSGIVGKFICVEFVLACADEWGGGPGEIRVQELVVKPSDAENPMWYHSLFGMPHIYTSGPYKGGLFYAGKVVRYRIRKPRGLTILQEILTEVSESETVDAPNRIVSPVS